jgi:hypothetical protein
MNPETPSVNRASGAAVGFLAASVVFIVLVAVLKFSVKPPAINAGRAATISQALFQIRTNETAALNFPGWIDPQRGIVRLPIETAMRMAVRDWQNPDAARSNLIERAEKAAAPAPVAPAKPNPFE